MAKDIETDQLAPLRVTTEWKDVEILSEVDVLATFKGYVPVVRILVAGSDIPRLLIIGAKSMLEPLKQMREDNVGKFKGLKFSIRKAGTERTAPYEFQ